MCENDQPLSKSRELGEDRAIPRRDFLQDALVANATAGGRALECHESITKNKHWRGTSSDDQANIQS